MKRLVTYLVFVFAVCKFDFAFAQPASLAPTLVGSTGNYSTAGFGSISSSVGEPVVTTTPLVGGIQLTQGFQQPLIQISISSMSASPDDSICLGKNATLSASIVNNNIPTTTYNWSPAASLSCSTCPNPVATPTITTTYTLVVSDGINGSDSDTIKIYVLPNPVATVTLSTNDSICAGSPTTLTGSGSGSTGPYSFVWSPGGTTTPAIIVSPPVGNNTFTVVVTDKFGCKGSATQTVTVLSTPTVSITGTTTVCSGSSTTLSASGANSYVWSPGGATTSSISTGVLTSNTTYTLTGNNFMCADTKTVSVTVAPLPTPTISASSSFTICNGQSTTLSASGGNTYSWNTGATVPSILVSPTSSTGYTLFAASAVGCVGITSQTVTVNPLPTPTITVSPSNNICLGTSGTIAASGGGTYVWSTGETTSVITITPTADTGYNVTITAAGCSAVGSASIIIQFPPSVNAGSPATICSGDTASLSGVVAGGSGSYGYLWIPSSGLSSTTIINPDAFPTSSATYSLVGTDLANGCSDTSSVIVSVNSIPTISVSPSTSTLCAGQSTTLSASGGISYSWSTTETTASIIITPTGSASYTVIGTDSKGCSDMAFASVSVNAPPTASISGASSICAGETATLTASGGGTYLWSPNGQTSASITENPTSNTTYTITVTDAAGCADTATHVLTTSPMPTVAITYNPASQVVCQEDSITLTASGGATYYWPNLLDSNASVTFLSPVSGVKNYSVVVTTAAGCLDTAIATMTITPTPSIVITGDSAICTGETTTLLASGGTIYSWSTTETTSSISVAPTTATGYTVFVTDGNGCNADSGITVVVNSPPTADINGQTNPPALTICSGASQVLAVTGAGITSYSWSTGAITSSISVSPTTTTGYAVTVTNAAGCTDTVTIMVNVNPVPTASISPAVTAICAGDGDLLTGSGGGSYSWSTGATTSSIIVVPTSTSTFSLIVTNGFGCKDTDTTTITVNPLPIVVISGNDTICAGQNSTLTASGGTYYSWNTGLTTSTIVVSPSSLTSYTVNVMDSIGCSIDDSIEVVVNTAPTPTVTASSYSVCSGSSTTLTASGGSSYQWNGGPSTSIFVVSPTVQTDYSVTVTQGTCSKDTFITVYVNSTPSVTVSVTTNNPCSGTLDTLYATVSSGTSPFTYFWNTGATTDSIFVAPTANTTYTVDITDANGCTATTNFSIGVVSPPTASISGSTTICSGNNTTLLASGGGTYSWSTGSTASSIVVSPTVNTGYDVTVSNGSCSDTASVMVNVTSSPVAVISSTDTNICSGTTVTISASGGATYSWSTTATTTSITDSPSGNTTYSVIVSNGSCSDTAALTINVSTVTASVSGNTNLCVGDSTTLIASGGSSYSWSTGATASTLVINATATGTTNYTVTVTGANNCTDDTVVTVVINAPPVPVITSSDADSAVCFGSSVTLTGTGGNTYLWSTGETTAVIAPVILGNTTFTLTAFNGNCSAVATHFITSLALPNITITPSDPDLTICLGYSISLTAGGGVIYQWLNNGSINVTIVVAPNTSTTYTLVGGGANGCYNFTTALVSLSNIAVDAGADVTICPGYTAQLNALVSGNTSTVSYLWSPSTLMADATVQNPSVNPDSTTSFTVEVTGDNCYAKDSVVVVVDRNAVCDFCEKIWNGITPNGDGANDVWWIDGIQSFPKNTVGIFNRWGTKVWDASGYNNKDIVWKGTNQQGEPLPDGTYYYVIEVNSGDRKETCTGWVEVTH